MVAALRRVSAITDAVVLLGWHGKARQGAGEMMQTDCSCDEHNADTHDTYLGTHPSSTTGDSEAVAVLS